MTEAASPTSTSGAHSTGTVCIVDDDEVVRDSLRAVLESRSYRVSEFGSGADLLASGAAAITDCLLIDVHMSEMTGIDVLRELAVRGISTPVILISGRSDGSVVAQAETLGAVALLDKPIGPAALFDMIRRAGAQRALSPTRDLRGRLRD